MLVVYENSNTQSDKLINATHSRGGHPGPNDAEAVAPLPRSHSQLRLSSVFLGARGGMLASALRDQGRIPGGGDRSLKDHRSLSGKGPDRVFQEVGPDTDIQEDWAWLD